VTCTESMAAGIVTGCNGTNVIMIDMRETKTIIDRS